MGRISPKAELMLRGLERRLAKQSEERNWPLSDQHEKVFQQSFADGWKEINEDGGRGGAQESLRFLARKANSSPEALLEHIILILWPYSIPPARRRATDIDCIKGFARRLRDTAWELRHSPVVGLSADMYPHYYRPRGAATPVIALQRPSWFTAGQDVVRLPDMLERYASFLENKARRLQNYAKQEPTENKYWKDCVDEAVTWVKQVTGKAQRAKVAAIVRVLRPSIAVGAEALRKRAQRQLKRRPA